jgi:hypothetical protein
LLCHHLLILTKRTVIARMIKYYIRNFDGSSILRVHSNVITAGVRYLRIHGRSCARNSRFTLKYLSERRMLQAEVLFKMKHAECPVHFFPEVVRISVALNRRFPVCCVSPHTSRSIEAIVIILYWKAILLGCM